MGYFKQSMQGVKWMGAFRFISRIAAFIRIFILARILLPSQFGLFGIASLMLTLMETFTKTGINVFLIQEKKDLEDYVDTAWVVSIIRGLVITLVLIFIAPVVSDFFNSDDSKNLIYLIAFVPFLRGFINPSRVRFLKDMEFNKEFKLSGLILLLDFSVTIAITFILRSPIGLVWGLIAGAALEVVLSFLLINPKPKFKFNLIKAKDIISKGKWVTLATVSDYVFSEGDDIAVGRILNTNSLGVYQVAYKISSLPITEITKVINQVTFPTFTKIREDKKRLEKAFLKTTLVVLTLSTAMGLILFLFPEQVVYVLLGKNWSSAAPVLRILAIFGVVRAVTISANPLFNSVSRQKYVAYYTMASVLGLGISFIPLVGTYGLIGVSYSVLVGSLFALPLVILFLHRIFK